MVKETGDKTMITKAEWQSLKVGDVLTDANNIDWTIDKVHKRGLEFIGVEGVYIYNFCKNYSLKKQVAPEPVIEMPQEKNKEIKIIEICYSGSNSVVGTIMYEHNVVDNYNQYKWVILVSFESFKYNCIPVINLCILSA